jgi:hypothetical protein
MTASEVEHREPEYLYNATFARRYFGRGWGAVQRLAEALWDDPVARSLSIDGVLRDGIGELSLRSLADVRSTTTRRRPFDTISIDAHGPTLRFEAHVRRRWFGVEVRLVCTSAREAETLGMTRFVDRRLARRRSGRPAETPSRGRVRGVVRNPWIVSLTVMLLGLLLTALLLS